MSLGILCERSDVGVVSAFTIEMKLIVKETNRQEQQYEKMKEVFIQEGLDLMAIKSLHDWYGGLGPNEKPEPLELEGEKWGLPPNTGRVIALPLRDFDDLVKEFQDLTDAIISCLPEGTKVRLSLCLQSPFKSAEIDLQTPRQRLKEIHANILEILI